MKGNRACTSVDRRLIKSKFIKDQVLEVDIVDLSINSNEKKRRVRVNLAMEMTRTRREAIVEKVLKSDKRLGSKERKEKFEMELTREERIEVLRT